LKIVEATRDRLRVIPQRKRRSTRRIMTALVPGWGNAVNSMGEDARPDRNTGPNFEKI
jgi:hypothetical protein